MIARRSLPLTVCALTSLAVLGAASGVSVDVAGVHHVFHVVLPVIAFGLFAAFVAHDSYKHGLPRFSWKLHS
jgi:hypothetical protein